MLLEAFLVFCITSAAFSSVHSAEHIPTDVRQLEDIIVKELPSARSCWRLLSANGTAGCAGPDTGSIVEPIQLWNEEGSVDGDRVILVKIGMAAEFLLKYLENDSLKKHVKGVLIDARERPTTLSFGEKFPLQGMPNKTFPYDHALQTWNPMGNGLRWKSFDIPIFLLDDELADHSTKSSEFNSKQGFSGHLHVAEMSMAMYGKRSSRNCLESGPLCSPIGAYSVLAATPQLDNAKQPIILIVAHMDSAGFFLQQIMGADSKISGLIAMLIAAQLLKKGGSQATFTHRIVFAALDGESWGYMGSKRMIWELSEGKEFSGNTIPLSLADVEKIIEIGSLGLSGKSTDVPQVFVHQQFGSKFTNSTQIKDAMVSSADASEELAIDVKAANVSNHGIPPSSLMVFLSRNTSIEGVVVAEYDGTYVNPYYDSYLDDDKNVDGGSIAAGAAMIAQAVHKLAGREGTIQVDAVAAKKLADDLVHCFLVSNPSLSCELVKGMSSVTNSPRLGQQYVGHMEYLNRHSQDQQYVKNMARFLFNFLGQQVADGEPSDGNCDGREKLCENSQICLGPIFSSLGQCWTSSVYFLGAYPLSLQWEEKPDEITATSFKLLAGDDVKKVEEFQSRFGWAPEQLWAESMWPVDPKVRFYMRESKHKDSVILAAGFVVLVVSIAIAIGSRFIFEARIKQA